MSRSLTFTAVNEPLAGPKWKARWDWSWPAYEAWFTARGGDAGPSRADCEAALRRHMPELLAPYRRLVALAGGGYRAARFLSGWCPPAYLGGCSLAARADGSEVRLVRNYDLSPDLNEGLLLRSAWRRPVMGMVEFLWGLSDGINDAGLCVALAYGGHSTVAPGFGVTTILRHVLETCDTVGEALVRLGRVPSHMAYNLVLADAGGRVASVELRPGGGLRRMDSAIATNHQHGGEGAERAEATRTRERHAHLGALLADGIAPSRLSERFLAEPLFQQDHAGGFGTLFTADYDPAGRRLRLLWPGESWTQDLNDFREGRRTIRYDAARPATWSRPAPGSPVPASPAADAWAEWGLALARHFTEIAVRGWPAGAPPSPPAQYRC